MSTAAPESQRTTFASFAAFYPFYLGEHANRTSRRLHVVGTSIGVLLAIVAVVRFEVPRDALEAVFGFRARERKLGGLGSCGPRNVTIRLKPGSLPFAAPDDSTTAARLLGARPRQLLLRALSDGEELEGHVAAPAAGAGVPIWARAASTAV